MIALLVFFLWQNKCDSDLWADPDNSRKGWGWGLAAVFSHHLTEDCADQRIKLLLQSVRTSVFLRKPIATCDFPGALDSLPTILSTLDPPVMSVYQ